MRLLRSGHPSEPQAPGSKPQATECGLVDSRFPIPKIHDSRFTLHESNAWGEEFGRNLRAPVLVTLEGDLGTGKTTLVQAMCRGVGIREDVTSPTFALVNEYHVNGGSVFHLDLY